MKSDVIEIENIDEVVDTCNDALDVGEEIEEAAKDGLDFGDFGTVMKIYPKLKEIFDDRKIFIQQAKKLNAEKLKEVYRLVAQKRGVEVGKVEAIFLEVLDFVSFTYSYLNNVVVGGLQVAEKAKNLAKLFKPA